MEPLLKIGFQLLIVCAKISILHVWLDSKNASVFDLFISCQKTAETKKFQNF